MQIERTDGKIKVKSEYNKDFITKAHELNGKWESPYWVFEEKVNEELEESLIEIYGEGFDDIEKVTIKISLDDYENPGENFFGQLIKFRTLTLVRRIHRDDPVILSPNTWVVKGKFDKSGGSNKYPEVTWEPGTIINAEVPLKFTTELPKGVTLLDDTIKEKLLNEKEKLMNRINEINKQLEVL